MIAVLDTNIVVSAAISAEGTPGKLLQAWKEGRFTLVTCPELLAELTDVFNRAKFRHLDSTLVADLLSSLELGSIHALDPRPRPWTRDPKDDYLVELAVRARAVLVTGDRDRLEAPGLPIETLTPADFLDKLEQMPQPPER